VGLTPDLNDDMRRVLFNHLIHPCVSDMYRSEFCFKQLLFIAKLLQDRTHDPPFQCPEAVAMTTEPSRSLNGSLFFSMNDFFAND
jgi:hypothetical protein